MLYLVNNRLLLINNGNSLYRIDNQTQPEPDMYTIPFTFTIDTTLGSNAGNTFELPLKNQGFNYVQYVYDDAVDDSLYFVPLSYDFIVDWGDGNTDHITTYNDINKTHTYSSNGVYQISILGKCEGWGKYDNLWEYNQLYNDSEKITSIDRWGNCGFVDLYTFCDSCSNLTNVYNVDSSQTFINTYNMFDMFYGCTSLTSLDASNWNVSNVVDMSAMFYGCTSLTTLDVTNWDVTSVLSMGGMFDGDTPLSVTSYDNLLIQFASLSNLTSNIELDANISQYSCAAEEAHDTLTSSPNNWSITDAGLNVTSCNDNPIPMDIGIGFDSTVLSIIQNTDNSYLVGGYFNKYQETTTYSIISLNNDGSINNGFTFGTAFFGNYVDKIILDNTNKLMVVGTFNRKIIRLNQDGSTDNTFNVGTGFNQGAESIIQDNNGKYVIGGNFTTYKGITSNKIIRLNQDGSIDNTFNVGTGASSTVYTIIQDNNGKYVVGGHFVSFNGTSSNRIIRLNQDGSIDNTFNVGTGFSYITDVIVRPFSIIQDNNGKYVVVGQFETYQGTTSNRIIRLNQDGSIDNTFNVGTGFNSVCYTIIQDNNGKYVVGGGFYSFNGTSCSRIIRLNQDGSIDNTFNVGTGFNDDVRTIILNNEGVYVIGGNFNTYQNVTYNRFIKLNQDGTPAMVV